jgi:hypothetical protein
MTIQFAQWFCTVQDLIADKQAPGADEARMFQAIREASDWVQKRMGWFVPVTAQRSFTGRGLSRLLLPPSLLAITSITNEGVTLSAADYLLKPDDGYWANGPFGELLVDEDSSLLLDWTSEQDGIVINGRWGKYQRSSLIGATVQDTTQQSDSQTTLKVSDGGKVSPGMVLLIGTEQEAVTGWGAPTENVTAINMVSGLAVTDEVVTVDDASLVNVGEILRMEFEQCKVLDRRVSTNKLSLMRGWNGTARVAHANDIAVDAYRTVNVDRGVNGTTAAVHASGTAISRYFVPDDILLLTKEIATLSVSKAQSGYQGRTGNAETGVVFYNDIFPKFDIEAIWRNYHIPRVG